MYNIAYSNLMRILEIIEILIRLYGIHGTRTSTAAIHCLYIYDIGFFSEHDKNKMTIQQT